MCSVTAAMIGMSVAGTLMQQQGQQQEAEGERKSSIFNAQVAANNATIARQQATQAHDIGKVQTARQQLKARQLIGLQRASSAGQGVLVDAGSAGDIAGDTRAQSRIDAANIRANTARQALGFLVQGANFDAGGGLILAEGSNRASAINAQASATLLKGAGSVASKWQDYKIATGKSPFA